MRIDEAHNLATQASQTHFRETSVTTQLKSGYADALRGAYNSIQTARDAKNDTGSERMAGLAALNAAASVYNAYQTITGSANAASAAPISAVSVSVSMGTSKSQSESNSSQRIAQGSRLLAGGSVSMPLVGDEARARCPALGDRIVLGAVAHVELPGADKPLSNRLLDVALSDAFAKAALLLAGWRRYAQHTVAGGAEVAGLRLRESGTRGDAVSSTKSSVSSRYARLTCT